MDEIKIDIVLNNEEQGAQGLCTSFEYCKYKGCKGKGEYHYNFYDDLIKEKEMKREVKLLQSDPSTMLILNTPIYIICKRVYNMLN